MHKIGNRIAYLRKQKGWSQTFLAEKINASREAIGKYERNEASPSVDTAKKIADAFEITLDYLVDENGFAALDKKTISRIQDIQALNKEDQQHVYALLDAFLHKTKIKSMMQ